MGRIGEACSSGGIKCVEAASSIYDVRCIEAYLSGVYE